MQRKGGGDLNCFKVRRICGSIAWVHELENIRPLITNPAIEFALNP